VEGSESAADRVILRFETAFGRLSAFPVAGATRDRLAPGLRVVFQSNYAIYYLCDGDRIEIVRVLHGARDAAALFDAAATPVAGD